MKNDERRQNTRVHFHTTASLQFSERLFKNCETRDLSVKGLFVQNVTGQEAGDKCEIDLHLSGATSELKLAMRGEIVRVQEDGVAVNFYEVDLDSFYHLKNIVYYNSVDPDDRGENSYEDIPDEDFT